MSNAADVSWNGERVMAASMGAMAVTDGVRLLSVNRAYADLYGFERPDDLVGEAVGSLFPQAERERFEQDILPACRRRGQWRGELTGRRRDGSTFTQDASLARMGDDQFVWFARDTAEGGRHLRRYERLVETIDDGVYVLDESLRVTFANDALCEIFGRSRDDILGRKATRFLVDEEERNAVEELRRRLVAGESNVGTFEVSGVGRDDERTYEVRSHLHPEPDGEFRGSVGVVRDVTDRKRRERTLQRQRDEMETLNRINELLLELTKELVETPSRDAIRRRVCEHLAESELYEVAWIAGPETDGDCLLPRASSGVELDAVETGSSTTAGTDGDPGKRALRTGEVQVSQNLRTDPAFESWRDAVPDRDVRSAAAVPLVHDGGKYGVLAVYATRPLAFSRREQAGLATLGNAVGFAINAVENRNLLFADSVVELEFAVTDSELVFVRLSERFDCELTVTGYVASPSGDWSVYLRVDGVSPAALREGTADDPDVKQLRVISDEGDSGRVEVVMRGPALNEVTDHGAMMTSGRVRGGRGSFRIEVPRTADVRRLVQRLQATYPESRLLARRELDRPVQRASELRQSIDDRLTERQREALYRAYHAGYFEWPRTSAAADIAEPMGIAETTFHYHLRNALDGLLTRLTEVERG